MAESDLNEVQAQKEEEFHAAREGEPAEGAEVSEKEAEQYAESTTPEDTSRAADVVEETDADVANADAADLDSLDLGDKEEEDKENGATD